MKIVAPPPEPRAAAPAKGRDPTAPAKGRGPTALPRRAFVEVLGEKRGLEPGAPSPRGQPPVAASGGASALRGLVARSFASEGRLDAIMAAARRGKTFSPAELIALQAEVFRHSQVVEVVSRTTDKLVGSVKQVMGTQV